MNTESKAKPAPPGPPSGTDALGPREDEYHLRAPKSLEFGELGVHQWQDSEQDPLQTQAMDRWQRAWRALRGALSGDR